MDLEKRRQAAMQAELSRVADFQGGLDKAMQGGATPVEALMGNRVIGDVSAINPGGGGSAVLSAADIAAQKQAAKIAGLRGDIRGYQDDVDSVYNQLFADLDTLIRSRAEEIDKTAGENIGKLTDQYVGSIPKIESSYASLGAGDSTDNTYAKVDAKTGYDGSVKEVGKQKEKDQTTLGEYDQTTRAGWGADREALNRIFGRLDETENEQDLVNTRNEVENKLGTAKATRASLMTDKGLKGAIADKTNGASRFDSIQGSLDAVLNSSLSGAVKEAAIQAIGQSAGLSDEEKNQIKANSGYTS